MKISPLVPEDATSEEDQRAEGLFDDEIIKYYQEFKLFNNSDYIGKSKGLSMNYDKNMKIELFRQDGDDGELQLIDTFHLTNLNETLKSEIEYLKNEREKEKAKAKRAAEKEKEKAKKSKNDTSEDDEKDKKEEPKEEPPKTEEGEDAPIPTPKIKISVEFTRSGILQITKANAGSHFITVEQVRKPAQLSMELMRQAKTRLRWYEQRDSDKIKTDKAKNDFESMIYKLREWLREDENAPYIEEDKKDATIEKLTEQEDWLYEDGSNENYTVYQDLHKNLSAQFDSFNKRKVEHENREAVIESANKALDKYIESLQDLKETKTWITDEERKEVEDRVTEIRDWLKEQIEKQSALELYQDPIFSTNEVVTKMNRLKKQYSKIANKKKPKSTKKASKEDKDVDEENEAKKDNEESKEDNNSENESQDDEKKEDL